MAMAVVGVFGTVVLVGVVESAIARLQMVRVPRPAGRRGRLLGPGADPVPVGRPVVNSTLQTMLALVILADLALLAVGRMRHLLALVGLQGALLAAMLLLMAPGRPSTHLVALCLAVFAIKAVGFPLLLGRTMSKVGVSAMVEPYVGFGVSVACGLAGLVFSFWLGSRLSIPDPAFAGLLVPATLSTVITGLLVIVERRKALTQVVGYLVMENGIFLFGAPLSSRSSIWWVELAILLDVLVAVFVMGHRHSPHQPDLRLHRSGPFLLPAGLTVIQALVLLPLAAGLAALGLGPDRPRRLVLILTALAHPALVLALALADQRPQEWDGMLVLDAPGLLFLGITSLLFLASAVYAVGYLRAETRGDRPGLRGRSPPSATLQSASSPPACSSSWRP